MNGTTEFLIRDNEAMLLFVAGSVLGVNFYDSWRQKTMALGATLAGYSIGSCQQQCENI